MRLIKPAPRIKTPELTLRPPAPADAPRLAALADDFDIARMTSRLPHPYGLADAEAFLARMETLDHQREISFAIETARDGLVGVVGLYPHHPLGPEIGYWIGRRFWGRGLATEAAKAALGWVQRAWGRRAVVSGHFTDNPASGRVLVKAGFLYTGERELRHSTARGEAAETRMMVWLA